eukprot:gene23443-30730_t
MATELGTSSVEFSRDGRFLLAGSLDGSTVVFDTSDWLLQRSLVANAAGEGSLYGAGGAGGGGHVCGGCYNAFWLQMLQVRGPSMVLVLVVVLVLVPCWWWCWWLAFYGAGSGGAAAGAGGLPSMVLVLVLLVVLVLVLVLVDCLLWAGAVVLLGGVRLVRWWIAFYGWCDGAAGGLQLVSGGLPSSGAGG